MLLFTDKDSTPPVFEALAANLESLGLVFADVSASQADVLEQFSVDKASSCELAPRAAAVCQQLPLVPLQQLMAQLSCLEGGLTASGCCMNESGL